MKSNFLNTLSGSASVGEMLSMEISNVRLLGENAESPFAGLGYKPDNWKAYIEFELCHSLPVVAGPVMSGNYIGYLPKVLAISHESLQHQQMNLRHMLKAYDPKNIPRDRIVGCVVATWFPKDPKGGWKMPEDKASAPAIRACAVVFKLAEGVNALLGKHLASREKQSVSIETITSFDNMGLALRSDLGTVTPLLEAEGDLRDAISRDGETGALRVGKTPKGEQVVLIYGLEKPVQFRGVGVTPNPAEREAEITAVHAERRGEWDGGETMGIAAEAVPMMLAGRTVRFASTGRCGTIRKVETSGRLCVPGNWSCGVEASEEDPAVLVELPQKRFVVHRLSAVAKSFC